MFGSFAWCWNFLFSYFIISFGGIVYKLLMNWIRHHVWSMIEDKRWSGPVWLVDAVLAWRPTILDNALLQLVRVTTNLFQFPFFACNSFVCWFVRFSALLGWNLNNFFSFELYLFFCVSSLSCSVYSLCCANIDAGTFLIEQKNDGGK